LSPSKKIPIGLARVRKELPPPTKIIKSRKKDQRKHVKDELRQELKATLERKSF
jgi:hypothetical protein